MAKRFVLFATVFWSVVNVAHPIVDSKVIDVSYESRISGIENRLAAGKFSKIASRRPDRSIEDQEYDWKEVLPNLYADIASQVSKLGTETEKEFASAFHDYFFDRDEKAKRTIASARKLDSLISKQLGNEHPFRSFIRITIGEALLAQGKYSQAALLLSRNLKRLNGVVGENNPHVAQSIELIGLCHTHRGSYRPAENALRKAAALFESTVGPDSKQTISCNNHLAYLLTRMGKYAEATQLAGHVVRFAKANYAKTDPELIKSLLFLGGSLQGEGKLTKAESFIRHALDLAVNQEKDSVLVGSCLAHQGICLRLQGRHREAEAAYQRAFQIFSKARGEVNRNTAVCLWNLAQIKVVREKYKEATPNIEKLITIQDKLKREANHDQTLGAHRLLIQCRRRQGLPVNGDHYVQLLQKTLEFNQRNYGAKSVQAISVMANLARFYDEFGKEKQALEMLTNGLELCREILGDHHADTIGFQRELGHLHYRRGELDLAARFLSAAADSFEATRNHRGITGLNSASETTDSRHLPLLAVALAKNRQFKEAWERLEQSTSRALLDDLVSQSLQTRAPSQYANRRENLDRLESINRSYVKVTHSAKRADPNLIAKLKSDYEDTVSNLRSLNTDAEHRFGVRAGGVYGLERIQAQIPNDTAIITWISLRWRQPDQAETWACILRNKGDPQWIQIKGGSGESIEAYASLANVSGQLDEPNVESLSDFRKDVEASKDSILSPLKKLLSDSQEGSTVRNLVVTFPIPFNIPIEVLTDHFRVSYTPSASIYAWLKENASDVRPTSQSPSLLAVADPTFSSTDKSLSSVESRRNAVETTYQSLPGTRAEAQALAELFDDDSRVLAGDQASESQLHQLASADELKAFSYIHFATHAEPNVIQPFQSSLILAQAEPPLSIDETLAHDYVLDSRLTANEMLNHWQLDAELVTLSACETLRGKFVPGEYYLGFSQALLFAGTRSVVVSMWPVRDDATSLLMQRFYANLLGKTAGISAPLGKAAALQEAKRWLRQLTVDDLDALMVDLTPALRSRVRSHRKDVAKKTARPFEHPYFWAPFILIGDPD